MTKNPRTKVEQRQGFDDTYSTQNTTSNEERIIH